MQVNPYNNIFYQYNKPAKLNQDAFWLEIQR